MTATLTLDLPFPQAASDCDCCLARLRGALAAQRGIERVDMDAAHQPAQLSLQYDPEILSLAEVQKLAQRAGADISRRYQHNRVAIEGMDCSDCVTVLQHGVKRLDGVLAVNVSYVTQELRVEFDARKTSWRTIEKRIRSLGYTIPSEGLRSWYQENRELLYSLASGALVLLGWLGATFWRFPAMLSLGLYLAAYVLGGWEIAPHAWHALRERQFDTDLLMVMAALGAALLGDWAEGALLLFLFSLGHALEERALDRARSAVRALANLTPKTALVRRDGRDVEVPVEQLQLDETVIVRQGVRVPVDGVVLAGMSGVDQAPVTGESVPVDKAPGTTVFAGSVNGEGALEVRVTRLARDSTLARVMTMVEEAQAQKSPTQQLAERFERVFVPVILVVDVLLIAIPPLFGVPFRVSFLRAMALLVAASPCALALGTPAAVLAGIALAARHGVLIKGGAHLENLGRLKAIAFDKTGTITQGWPEVTEVISLAPSLSEAELLGLAAAVEGRSGHPLGQAVARAAQARSLVLPAVGEVESVTGRGLRANVEGRALLVGSPQFLAECGLPASAELERQVEELQASGRTVMVVALEGQAVGLLALADQLREEVPPTLARLKRLGLREMVLLTGDNARVAEAIARQAGLTDFCADLMPAGKVTAIRELVDRHGEVAMIGDGVNDAPALAHATVGVAMGGAGTDVALETADVVLMADNVATLPFAVGLGRATKAIIGQNLAIALGVIVLLVGASLAGWTGIGLAVFLHEGSTIVVVLNALRLLAFRARTD